MTATTPTDGTADKSITVFCPTGKKVLGGGSRILGNIGNTFLQDTRPESELQWTVRAESQTGNPWSLTVYAVCASVG